MKNETLGDRIQKARKAKGWTQVKLAAKLGIDQTALSKYETGQREPSAGLVAQLSCVLNMTTDYLIFGDKRNQINNTDDSSKSLNRINNLLFGRDDKVLKEVFDVATAIINNHSA